MKEDENPFASPLSSPALPVHDAPVTFPRRALLGSLLVMLPWPMLGIAACMGLSLFEKSSEAIFMFGSITMIFLLPLAFVVTSEWIYGTLIGIVWLLVLFLPLWLGKRALRPRFHVQTVLVCQSLFSAMQAGLGFLMILGKQC
ncbi:hypothetical protein [Neorhodopirellula pilleata]|uniref:Uncharacterized protein n=1 Tax=Neorhodopirellula pilleata TaxID=2714738 RepID=A0A5C5ZG27_9BACT|nr:hypothetical protein [Neorhodopirellula pilleata]TWT86379.1 hypothetical protein Pla100_60860 [Neorhodopirellula pilleata]